MTEALEFLRRLRPGGPWQLVAIQPDRIGPGRVRGCRALTMAAARQFISANNARNTHFHINPSFRIDGVKASKADISGIEFVHADLDPAPGESPADAKERYSAGLRASGLPAPNFVIDSGNGIQGLWRIAAVSVEDPSDPVVARVEGISKAVMGLLGCHDTSTHNIDRIFRLPGTTNWPNEVKRARGRVPVMARLISASDGLHALEQFPQPSSDTHATTGLGSGEPGGEYDPLKHDWRAVVAKYAPRLKSVHRRIMIAEHMESPNRSRMIFMAAVELHDVGATWDEIAAVVWRSPYFIDKQTQSIDRLDSELSRIKKYLARKSRK